MIIQDIDSKLFFTGARSYHWSNDKDLARELTTEEADNLKRNLEDLGYKIKIIDAQLDD